MHRINTLAFPRRSTQIDGNTGWTKSPYGHCGGIRIRPAIPDATARRLVRFFLPGQNTAPEFVFRIQFNADGTLAHLLQVDSALAGHSGAGLTREEGYGLFGYDASYPNVTPSQLEALNYSTWLPTIGGYGINARSSANGIDRSYGQSYLTGLGTARTGANNLGTAIDTNRWAGGGGGMDMYVSTVSVVAGKTKVYKSTIGEAWKYKTAPLYVMAGPRLYKDMSGTTCDIDTMPFYSFCFIYDASFHAGVVGETVGDIYVKSPWIQTGTNTCFASIDYPVLCAAFLGHSDGGIRQFVWQGDDYEGRWSRFLGYIAPPGFAVGFNESGWTSFGNKVLTDAGGPIGGYGNTNFTVRLPRKATSCGTSAKLTMSLRERDDQVHRVQGHSSSLRRSHYGPGDVRVRHGRPLQGGASCMRHRRHSIPVCVSWRDGYPNAMCFRVYYPGSDRPESVLLDEGSASQQCWNGSSNRQAIHGRGELSRHRKERARKTGLSLIS
jgi:hypothetical protein